MPIIGEQARQSDAPIALAVNYSPAAAELRRRGAIAFDRYKCPAWPSLLAEVQVLGPVYVHFPLRVGTGRGEAIDTETGRPADWARVRRLLQQTDTPLVDVHLVPEAEDHPHLPLEAAGPAEVSALCEALIRDVRAVQAQFGREQVIAENDSNDWGRGFRAAAMPEVIRRVVEETGCGFLLDLSHARLAAAYLGMDLHEYIEALPVSHVREVHITGVQPLAGQWLERVSRPGADPALAADLGGKPVDHLPMTEADWGLLRWTLGRIAAGDWARPWVVSFEYGGVGGFWEAVLEPNVLAEQVPRLYEMIRQASGVIRTA